MAVCSKFFYPRILMLIECHFDRNRASVKLFELGVRTPMGIFLGLWYAGVSIFGVFVRQAAISGIILAYSKQRI